MTHSKALIPIMQPPETAPLCPHFGPCGGCQLQHLLYPTQLAGKQQRLATLLSETNITTYPPIQTHAADPWHYRNRIRLRVEQTGDTFALGYNQYNSNDFLPIHTCPISAGILLHAAQTLISLSQHHSFAKKWLAATAELELFTTPDESRLQLTFLLRSAPDLAPDQLARSFRSICDELKQNIPQLLGAGAEILRSTRANSPKPRTTRRSAANFPAPTWGTPGLLYPVTINTKSEQLWVSRASFFQVNRFLAEPLVSVATSNLLQTKGLAWDLFAGVGLFTRALAPHFARLVAVESAPTATADLAAAKLPNLRIVTATVLDFLRIAALDRDRPDLVLLDPPRAGLGLEAANLLARLKPARIVYVSCDPATLVRDLGAMLSSGYNLAELHLVDMFPQTSHQETVAILDRIDDQAPPVQG